MNCECCGANSYDLRKSNQIINQLGLTNPKRVGYLIDMCEKNRFESKVAFYDWYEQEFHGRLSKIINEFKDIVKCTQDEAYEAIVHRVICESWVGWDREERAYNSLAERYKRCEFRHVSKEDDYKYGIDFYVYKNDELIGAIQVKPPSWAGTASYLVTAKQSLKKKNDLFLKDFGVSVYTIIMNEGNQFIYYKG